LRLAGAHRPALYAASDAALAAATGLAAPASAAFTTSAVPCPTCLGAMACLPTGRSGDPSSGGCALAVALRASRVAAGHADVSGFRLHVQLPPSLCGVREHAAWFLAQAAFAQAAQDALAFAAAQAAVAQAVAAGSAPAAFTEAETAAEAVTVPGAAAGALLPAQPAKAFSPPLAAAASGWPAGWPVPGAPPGAGLLTRASSRAVPLKEALKWRLASRLPHTLGLPALPPPAWATGASAGHALRASSDAAAASARGESPFAVAAAFGVVAVSELCALDLCVEPSVEPSVAALSDAPSGAAAADGQLAELLGLGPASDQRGGSGGGFGGGGGKRARGGWDAGGGGGKWAKGGKGGKGSKGGKGGKRERDASTSAADAVVSDDAVASSAAKGSTEAATAAAAAAAADAAASVPNGEAMNARCEAMNADGQRALAAWLAAQAAPAAGPESSAATAAPTALAWTCAWQRPPILLGGRYASSALGAFSGGVWSERCPISFVLSVSVS
jgi:hypothetical protein